MQNVCLKSRTRDVCGRFVVAVSFADGNVCADEKWDRVIRLVESRIQRHCEMMQDGVDELLSFCYGALLN